MTTPDRCPVAGTFDSASDCVRIGCEGMALYEVAAAACRMVAKLETGEVPGSGAIDLDALWRESVRDGGDRGPATITIPEATT